MKKQPVVIRPPNPVGTGFLVEAGKTLMGWWNRQGARLPEPGERYRLWWRAKMRSLEGQTAGPGVFDDTLEQMRLYAEDARRWWSTGESDTEPPPVFADSPTLVKAVTGVDPEDAVDAVRAGSSLVWGAAALGLVAWLVWRK